MERINMQILLKRRKDDLSSFTTKLQHGGV